MSLPIASVVFSWLVIALGACGDNVDPPPDAGCISRSCGYEARPDAPPIDGELAPRTCAELGCGPETLPKACKTDPTQCTCHGERCTP
jgi:hypothetical protein